MKKFFRSRTRASEQNSKRGKSTNEVLQESKTYDYAIDEPKLDILSDRRITVRGWLVPRNDLNLIGLRLRNNDKVHEIPFGLERNDVAKAFPDVEFQKALKSGFSLDIEFEDGTLDIEADLGNGYEGVHNFRLKYAGDTPLSIYNPFLANNWAEHINLLEGESKYFFENSINRTFEYTAGDTKLLAFYLPQFYPIPENDNAWGKGFTEWRNVTTARPRFIGHRQPILPRDLGYYDLRLEQNLHEQIKLAKKNGLSGFCFYYYWFSGKRLLDTPINSFIKHQEWDFNFAICWANENWTRRWDGLHDDIIIAQKYLPQDPLNFIKDVEHILLDQRYIRVDGKPLLMVYRASELKDAKQYVKVWREYFRKKHRLDLHLVHVMSFENKNPADFSFDAGVEFMPQGISFNSNSFVKNTPPTINVKKDLIDIRYEGTVYDYREIVLNEKFHKKNYEFSTYKCLMPSWDNDARKKGKQSGTYYYSNPDLYSTWLERILVNKPPFIFINAWNEWAEGTTLEPTLHYGHAILNRTCEVAAKYSRNKKNIKNFPRFGIKKSKNSDLAVLVHLYYPKQWAYISKKLTNINCQWDLYVTMDEKDNQFIKKIKEDYPRARISLVPNRGRDILPFVHLARRLEQVGYKIILKLHTKKSTHRKDGEKWFEELIDNLLPNKKSVSKIINLLSSSDSFIGPKGHYVSLKENMGSNEDYLKLLLTKIYGENRASGIIKHPDNYAFFGGSMFWSNLNAIKRVLDLYLMPQDFESEKGQIDGTLAHAVERLLGLVPQIDGSSVYVSSRLGLKNVQIKDIAKNYKYVR